MSNVCVHQHSSVGDVFVIAWDARGEQAVGVIGPLDGEERYELWQIGPEQYYADCARNGYDVAEDAAWASNEDWSCPLDDHDRFNLAHTIAFEVSID
jgi:hypothetical protein